MKRLIIAVVLITSIVALTLPTRSQGLLVVQTQFPAAEPPFPDFTDVVLAVGVHNFNPVGYPAGVGVNYDNATPEPNDMLFTGLAPFPLDWASVVGSAPYLINTWNDQTVNGNLASPQTAVLDVTAKEVQFDGSTSYLSNGDFSFSVGANAATLYLYFKATDLTATGVLCETSTNPTVTTGAISVQMVAGVLTARVTAPVTHLFNTKIKTISDNNYHLMSLVIDTTNATPADQVQMWVDGSTSGVSSPISTDLASAWLGNNLNVGARNAGSSLFFTGAMKELLVFGVNHDDATRQSWEVYITYAVGT